MPGMVTKFDDFQPNAQSVPEYRCKPGCLLLPLSRHPTEWSNVRCEDRADMAIVTAKCPLMILSGRSDQSGVFKGRSDHARVMRPVSARATSTVTGYAPNPKISCQFR